MSEFKPKTEFGKELFAIRNKAIKDGMRLLNLEEVLEETRRRRGGVDRFKADDENKKDLQ